LDFDLPETRAYVLSALEVLPCEITKIGSASICAFFNAGKESTFAFRSDMDALPITEQSGCSYASIHPGKMHACGHDGHMAILLTFAEEIAKRLHDLPHNALLVFQAAEETTGGAFEICESGIFERYGVSRIFGLHLWPECPKGTLICRRGEFMARTCNLDVEIFGKSAHAAKHGQGIDALLIGLEFVKRAYEMERSEIEPNVRRLIKFGMFHSGTAMNIVSGYSRISGTMRCFNDDVIGFLSGRLSSLAHDLEGEYGCRISISFFEGYPALINPSGAFDEFKKAISMPWGTAGGTAGQPRPDAAGGLAGHSAGDGGQGGDAASGLSGGQAGQPLALIEPDAPTLIAEDFSFYLQKAPGVYFHLGTGADTPLHNSKYDLDESVLPIGVEAFFRLLYNA
jgi:hippurate hydrolase